MKCASSGCGPPNWSSGTGVPSPVSRRPRREVLQLSAPAYVADDDVELAVRAERNYPAVVVAAAAAAPRRPGPAGWGSRRFERLAA